MYIAYQINLWKVAGNLPLCYVTIIKVTNIVFELVNVIVESASINGKH